MVLSGPVSVTGRPLRMTSPSVGLSRPARMLSRVVLPQPDGPTKQTNCSSSIVRLIFLIAVISFVPFPCSARNCLPMFLASSLAMLYHRVIYLLYEIAGVTKLLHLIYSASV